jgi:hypothetical protein
MVLGLGTGIIMMVSVMMMVKMTPPHRFLG